MDTGVSGALAVLDICAANATAVFARLPSSSTRARFPRLHIDRGLTGHVLDRIAATGLAAYAE